MSSGWNDAINICRRAPWALRMFVVAVATLKLKGIDGMAPPGIILMIIEPLVFPISFVFRTSLSMDWGLSYWTFPELFSLSLHSLSGWEHSYIAIEVALMVDLRIKVKQVKWRKMQWARGWYELTNICWLNDFGKLGVLRERETKRGRLLHARGSKDKLCVRK